MSGKWIIAVLQGKGQLDKPMNFSLSSYKNITLLPDGTCTVDLSDYTKSESSKSFSLTSGDYLECDAEHYVAGFKDLESFFNQQIVSKIEQFEYTDLMEEQ